MEFKLRGALNGADEVKAANYPRIRFFTVAEHPAYHHTDLVSGTWNAVSPETAAQVSAVAYYFARRVQQETQIPIGLVVDAVGGTPAETWTSVAALRQLGGLDVPLAELERVAAETGPEYGNYVMSWYDRYDVGMKGNWSESRAGRFQLEERRHFRRLRCAWRARHARGRLVPQRSRAARSASGRPRPWCSSGSSSAWTRSTSTESLSAAARGSRIRECTVLGMAF